MKALKIDLYLCNRRPTNQVLAFEMFHSLTLVKVALLCLCSSILIFVTIQRFVISS